jgi:2'-5' RNA ligase
MTPAEKLPLNWVPAENWHVTVAFLGEVQSRSLARLDAAVAPAAAACPPLSLTLSALEWFPSPLKPRLLTLRVDADEALLTLQSDVVAALRREGFHTENRPFRPHLTLARLRGSQKRFNPPALPPIPTFDFEPRELLLFESVRAGRAPVYRPLQHFELAA